MAGAITLTALTSRTLLAEGQGLVATDLAAANE
jgi:hypothetical protein